MTQREYRPLVIVGGGLAGLAAAAEASRAGLATTLLEQREQVQGPRSLLESAGGAGAELRVDTTAWGLWGRDVAILSSRTGGGVITAQQVILATGAFERPVAFPGWTLPGVLTAAGARRLLQQNVAPGERVCVAGYGHWAGSIAAELKAAGVRVIEVVDAAARTGRRVVRAEGDERVERVVVAQAAADWSARDSQQRVVHADALVLAWGLLPENQLARLAGCRVLGSAWLNPAVERDPWTRTSVPGVLVAGDAGGICRREAAVEQGRLAGLAAALDLGAIDQQTAELRSRAVRRRLAAAQAADSYGMAPRSGAFAGIEADTIICRCEDVTMHEIGERLFEGSTEPGPVIAETRAAMGVCQGRHCASLVAAVISRLTGVGLEHIPSVTPRPPVLPVPLGAIAEPPPHFEPLLDEAAP